MPKDDPARADKALPKPGANGSPDSILPRKARAGPTAPDGPARWTGREKALRKRLEQGQTIAVSTTADQALILWTQEQGLFVSLVGKTEWGDWDALGQDGQADELFAAFVVYVALKKQLHPRIGRLKGKALGFGQQATRCQADYLALLADGGSDLVCQMLQTAASYTEADLERLVDWARGQLPQPPRENDEPGTPQSKGRRGSEAYQQAVEAVHALSRKEKQQLLHWLEQGCPE